MVKKLTVMAVILLLSCSVYSSLSSKENEKNFLNNTYKIDSLKHNDKVLGALELENKILFVTNKNGLELYSCEKNKLDVSDKLDEMDSFWDHNQIITYNDSFILLQGSFQKLQFRILEWSELGQKVLFEGDYQFIPSFSLFEEELLLVYSNNNKSLAIRIYLQTGKVEEVFSTFFSIENNKITGKLMINGSLDADSIACQVVEYKNESMDSGGRSSIWISPKKNLENVSKYQLETKSLFVGVSGSYLILSKYNVDTPLMESSVLAKIYNDKVQEVMAFAETYSGNDVISSYFKDNVLYFATPRAAYCFNLTTSNLAIKRFVERGGISHNQGYFLHMQEEVFVYCKSWDDFVEINFIRMGENYER